MKMVFALISLLLCSNTFAFGVSPFSGVETYFKRWVDSGKDSQETKTKKNYKNQQQNLKTMQGELQELRKLGSESVKQYVNQEELISITQARINAFKNNRYNKAKNNLDKYQAQIEGKKGLKTKIASAKKNLGDEKKKLASHSDKRKKLYAQINEVGEDLLAAHDLNADSVLLGKILKKRRALKASLAKVEEEEAGAKNNIKMINDNIANYELGIKEGMSPSRIKLALAKNEYFHARRGLKRLESVLSTQKEEFAKINKAQEENENKLVKLTGKIEKQVKKVAATGKALDKEKEVAFKTALKGHVKDLLSNKKMSNLKMQMLLGDFTSVAADYYEDAASQAKFIKELEKQLPGSLDKSPLGTYIQNKIEVAKSNNLCSCSPGKETLGIDRSNSMKKMIDSQKKSGNTEKPKAQPKP